MTVTPSASSVAARDRMTRQRRVHTAPEIAVRRALHRRGLRFRLFVAVPQTRRTIDIAFTKARVAVMIDGCYWHGCPVHGTQPKANATWWAEKLTANTTRDADTTRRLTSEGWVVIRAWEHEDPEDVAVRVHQVVTSRRGPTA
jgi:DNA mismatch endonuclease (patch repair protein)